MIHPIVLLQAWLNEEKEAGAKSAQHAVLSTRNIEGSSHGRVVAIREVQTRGLVFFTQMRTRKVEDIKVCPEVAITFWFERFQREVIVEGKAEFLSVSENENYWNAYPKEAQIRFCSYAPTSGLTIESKLILEQKRAEIVRGYQNEASLPMSPDYCGVLVIPQRFLFYAYRLDELSDVFGYQLVGKDWKKSTVSP